MGILEQNIAFLFCRDIGDSKYTVFDSNLECNDDFYNNTVLPVNLASLILFTVIIPGILFKKVFKNRKKFSEYLI